MSGRVVCLPLTVGANARARRVRRRKCFSKRRQIKGPSFLLRLCESKRFLHNKISFPSSDLIARKLNNNQLC